MRRLAEPSTPAVPRGQVVAVGTVDRWIDTLVELERGVELSRQVSQLAAYNRIRLKSFINLPSYLVCMLVSSQNTCLPPAAPGGGCKGLKRGR